MTGKSSLKQILIVEDVDEMRELLQQAVGRAPGLGVSGTARSTWEARLLISRNRPDLVLLDEVLPGESSLDLLRELKSQGIPVLLVSGMVESKHPVPPEALGRLHKPDWGSLEETAKSIGDAIRKALQGS